MNVNLNDRATVTLTSTGAATYNRYLSQFTYPGRQEPNKKAGYVLSTQLWELFKIFGDSIYMGCNVPFENNVMEISSCFGESA